MSLTASDHCPSLDVDVSSEGWAWPKAPPTPLVVSTFVGLRVIVPKGTAQGAPGPLHLPQPAQEGGGLSFIKSLRFLHD